MKRLTKATSLLILLSAVALGAGRPDGRLVRDLDGCDSASRAAAQDSVKPRSRLRSFENRNGEAFFTRAYALHQSQRYEDAIESFKGSVALGYRAETAMYNIACGYSMLNDKETALAWLERALGEGFDRTELVKEDSDLDYLRSDPRFQILVASMPAPRSAKRLIVTIDNKRSSGGEEAASRFDQLMRESSQDGRQWYEVGSRLLEARDLDRSIAALQRAVEHLGYKADSAMYNLACAYSLKGDREAGLDWLVKAVNAGFDGGTDKLRTDSDIKFLRGDQRFEAIAKLSHDLSLSQFTNGSGDGSGYSARQWKPAVDFYTSFVQTNPAIGRAWFNLGYALHYSREHSRAIEAFNRAIQLGYRPPTAMYNIACANSMMNQVDLAFEWLEKAARAGFDVENYIKSDEDLDNLRSDPRFARFGKPDRSEHHKENK